MMPPFEEYGLLPPGVHWTFRDEFLQRFGTRRWRLRLAPGIRAAIENLKDAGCLTVYVNGSIITAKEVPNDFGA